MSTHRLDPDPRDLLQKRAAVRRATRTQLVSLRDTAKALLAQFPDAEVPQPAELDAEGDVAAALSSMKKLTQRAQTNRDERHETVRAIETVKARIAEQQRQIVVVEQRLAQERAAAERVRLQQEQEQKKKQMMLLAGLAAVVVILLLFLLK